jgi:hypothetical protein
MTKTSEGVKNRIEKPKGEHNAGPLPKKGKKNAK